MNALTSKKKNIILFSALLLTGGILFFRNIKNKERENRYVLSQVQKGTIILTVSGSGQISAKDQIDVKSKISGEVEKIFVDKEQTVKKGELLLKLKTKDFEEAIDDAKLALDDAETRLQNLKQNKETSEKDLNDLFDDVFNALSLTFSTLPPAMTDMEKTFTESSYNGDQADIDYYRSVFALYRGYSFLKNEKEEKFLALKEKYQKARNDFMFVSRNSSQRLLEDWAKGTSSLLLEISDLAKEGRDIISFYKEVISKENLTPAISLSVTDTQFKTLSSVVTSMDQLYSNLISLSKKIDQNRQSILNYEDQIRLQEKTIKQKENLLEKAKDNYESCFIKADFDGKIAKVNVKEGDSISGTTVLFTLIAKEKVAEISLNEIDAAKVKIGQKASLTFDAIPDLILTGKIIEIDSVGSISQGVVSYGAKIVLDSDEERIKPSMSVTAEIIVEAKTDVLLLPNSAVKTGGNLKYVELINAAPETQAQLKIGNQTILPKGIQIKNQNVETGISNDNLTEIISGLKEGDIVISSKVLNQKSQSQTQTNQFRLQIPGMQPQIRR